MSYKVLNVSILYNVCGSIFIRNCQFMLQTLCENECNVCLQIEIYIAQWQNDVPIVFLKYKK